MPFLPLKIIGDLEGQECSASMDLGRPMPFVSSQYSLGRWSDWMRFTMACSLGSGTSVE